METFSCVGEAADSNLSSALCDSPASPLPGMTCWSQGRVGCSKHVDMGRLLQPNSLQPCSHTALPHSLLLRQMNVTPNAFSLAFSCRKWPLNVVLSPVKLIMAKIGAAQAASELDSVSGSQSAPDRPGNSAQVWVLWVKALLALTCPTQWLCCHC